MTARPRITMLDHRDSFVFNLVRYLVELGADVTTLPSHSITIADIEASAPDALVLSPGPCTPNEAGISLETITHYADRCPILGVCLGHQAIAQAFGWTISRALEPLYGEAREISHDGSGVFDALPAPLTVGLYHSLVATAETNGPLRVTATSPAGEIMGLAHKDYPIYGVQFHPESILSEHGHALLGNFLKLIDTSRG